MPEPFSLAGRAWFPVARRGGQREFLRLCDISDPDILRIATGRPDFDIALTEFLIGLLAVTMDGLDARAWPQRLLAPPSCADLKAAFAPLAPALVLDGEGPRFFQDREQLEGKGTPIGALLIDTAGSATHFIKEGRAEVVSRIGAALALMTLQTQAPSGGAGHRTSLRGGGPLTTLVVPGLPNNAEPSLWQRLWANTPDELQATPEELPRVFPWLSPTRISDKGGDITTPEDVHPAQAFFGLPRRIRLIFEPNTDGRPCDLTGIVDEVIVTSYITRPWGTNYTNWSRKHPLSPYYKAKPLDAEFLPLHLKSSRVGYRQYIGLALTDPDGVKVPAACVSEFGKRARSLEGAEQAAQLNCRLLVAGYAMDNMKPPDFGEALVPLVITGNETSDKNLRDMGLRLVASAELVANGLVSSVRTALFGPKGEADRDSTVLDPVRQRFWGDTEQAFYNTLRSAAEALVTPEGAPVNRPGGAKADVGRDWLQQLKRHAFRIFDETVPIEDASADDIAHVVEGRKTLCLMLDGYGPGGKKLYTALGLPEPDKSPKKKKQGAAA